LKEDDEKKSVLRFASPSHGGFSGRAVLKKDTIWFREPRGLNPRKADLQRGASVGIHEERGLITLLPSASKTPRGNEESTAVGLFKPSFTRVRGSRGKSRPNISELRTAKPDSPVRGSGEARRKLPVE